MGGGICEGDGVGDGGGAHEEADGREELFLRYLHVWRHVHEECGGEVMAFRVLGVVVAGAADEETGALGDGGGDEGFEVGEAGGGDHGADVYAWAEGCDAGFEEREERAVGGREGDDAFDADTVLA